MKILEPINSKIVFIVKRVLKIKKIKRLSKNLFVLILNPNGIIQKFFKKAKDYNCNFFQIGLTW